MTTRLRKPFAPFSIQIPYRSDAPAIDQDANGQATGFVHLLPATNRTKSDNIVAPTPDLEFLKQELLVTDINNVQHWLWACGRPMPPRPLHYQRLLSREIVITESPQLHLVWGDKRIFIKPLPSYLVDKAFWETHILHHDDNPDYIKIDECARGFLFSYCALIAYESDYRIAKEKGLLPEFVDWWTWKQLSSEILKNHCYDSVNQRYWYGELRLSRLNKVYRMRRGHFFRGYSRVTGHAIYGDLMRDNFTALASVLGYVVIVLTAMQVGLATTDLMDNKAFQSVSYGFTVFAILAPLIATVAIVAFVSIWAVFNYKATVKYEGRRFTDMGVEASWRVQPPPSGSAVQNGNGQWIESGDDK
ncbi:hypothetical protein PT974_05256 [Cladobotryum mycophilum]|uniref:Subtilisin-like serine protease n=1 Tax=Cladobotryum mycophilum TaxID=491253 RepID=A0ABR0SI73_9HYPO